jgi:hypothetical protein
MLKECKIKEYKYKLQRAKTEGTRKRGRPYKRWSDEDEDDLNTMKIKNMQAVARDNQECTKIVVEPRSTSDCTTWKEGEYQIYNMFQFY